ncbi:Hypothetical_protein [Hexamita inflata]|uniref:Hypothetical_protein n=1 Tax=Hexamita inflata TaxID=28002 RepID=A0AA86PBL0_9EUKA|nr:Hypothetical protein HINF_LOCUS20769 [Hexamita inflata]
MGPEPYTICVWFRYIYNLEISRAATPKQQMIFGVQVVYRSWPSGRNETTNRIRPPTRTGHCCFSSVSFITYSPRQKILKRPSAVAVREPERNFWKLTILVVCTLITHYYDLFYINVLKASIWVPSRILSVCGLDIFTTQKYLEPRLQNSKRYLVCRQYIAPGLLDVMKRRTAFGHRRALDTAVSLLYHLSPTARARRYSKDLLPWLSREPERNFWK